MPWFKVSDDFHSHPKAMAAGSAAIGLWAVAGSWSSANLQGGFVPDYVIPRLAEDGPSLARKLVAAGLWTRVKGGYRYHQWDERNPSLEVAEKLGEKRSQIARYGNHERWHAARNLVIDGCEWCKGAWPP
ncbi:MAG: hypothetical protein ACRDP4_05660 [Nocardioidaceae bacterium]